jgi:UDP-N-acetylglucosamine transferase subunit ALG13
MTLKLVVAVGTHEQPFQRLLDAVRNLPSDLEIEARVQYGVGEWNPIPDIIAVPYVPAHSMADWYQWADVTLTQASPGFVFSALAGRAWPLILGRSVRYNEHVDDHQLVFEAAAADLGLATALGSETEIPAALLQEARAEAVDRSNKAAAAWAESEKRTAAFQLAFEDFSSKLL